MGDQSICYVGEDLIKYNYTIPYHPGIAPYVIVFVATVNYRLIPGPLTVYTAGTITEAIATTDQGSVISHYATRGGTSDP